MEPPPCVVPLSTSLPPPHPHVNAQPRFCLINAPARALSRRKKKFSSGENYILRRVRQKPIEGRACAWRWAVLNAWVLANGSLVWSAFPAWRTGRALHLPSVAMIQVFGSWWIFFFFFIEIEIEPLWCRVERKGDSGSRTSKSAIFLITKVILGRSDLRSLLSDDVLGSLCLQGTKPITFWSYYTLGNWSPALSSSRAKGTTIPDKCFQDNTRLLLVL